MSAHAVVAEAGEITSGVQIALDLTVDLDGSAKPACMIRSLLRHLD